MRKFYRLLGGLAVAGALAGCDDPLNVENENNPGIDNVTGRPSDLETLIANSWAIAFQATHGANGSLYPAFLVLGLESYSGNSNFCMATRGAIPRNQIDNARGNQCLGENYRDYQFGHRAARVAAIGINTLNREGYTLGSEPQNQRARAFARFVMGVSLGRIAMAYDSGIAVSENDDVEAVLPMVGYEALGEYALAMIDSAIAIAGDPTIIGTETFPATWLNIVGVTTPANFIRLARSYKAQIRASLARTPSERAAVDWAEVIDDATNGITANYVIEADPNRGWSVAWPIQHYLFQSWHQAWQFVVGMADVSGAYQTWLLTNDNDKVPFLITTPDRRFPAGASRTAQTTASVAPSISTASDNSGIYWRNRPPGSDVLTSNTLANSYYDFIRFQAFHSPALRVGVFPLMTRAEIDLLAAEGYIRNGDFAEAAVLIDRTRVARGLPSVAGLTAGQPVPGGSSCVPRIPIPSGTRTWSGTACGDIFEAMKWEYRMETAFTGYGMWYFAGRGWGDLPEGTPIHFPVPYQEMDVRAEQPFYNFGGVGGTDAAPVGTYGL
ncbi:MAG: hypothetical protein M3373_01090 [Gemmatimonadota bacterium]|nr:hypothetical protein [Gemmatimonadota bacterium]